jgi:hypothetical protein
MTEASGIAGSLCHCFPLPAEGCRGGIYAAPTAFGLGVCLSANPYKFGTICTAAGSLKVQ